MATHYRETIADVLKGFDNAQHSDAFYEALAWEGLREAGYTAKRLTETQDNQNYDLQSIVESSTQICN